MRTKADSPKKRLTDGMIRREFRVDLQTKVEKFEADLAEGMKIVKDMVEEIGNRSKVIKKVFSSPFYLIKWIFVHVFCPQLKLTNRSSR